MIINQELNEEWYGCYFCIISWIYGKNDTYAYLSIKN